MRAELSQLYAVCQRSEHVFGSPLVPVSPATSGHPVPRFVFFGDSTSRESVHLALHAGFDARDLRGSLALLRFIEQLTLEPALGQGLQLSLFPLVDVAGFAGIRRERPPAAGLVSGRPPPEAYLLNQDARQNRYHGFIRIESAAIDDAILLREYGAAFLLPAGRIETVPTNLGEPVPLVWETTAAPSSLLPSPLAAGAPAFELVLGVPGHWSPGLFRDSVTGVLRHLIARLRSFQAFAPDL